MIYSVSSSGDFPHLNLPFFRMQVKKIGLMTKVFDPLRKKYVALTPEEYVRQQFTNWLRNYLHYPASLMANEISLDLNGTKKRCDSIVFDRNGLPFMILEYKAPYINITQEVFDQIVRYNLVLKAKYLVVSNGMKHYCCIINYTDETYQFLPSVPDYDCLI